MPPILPPGEFHVHINIFSDINGTAQTIVHMKLAYEISPVGVVDFWPDRFADNTLNMHNTCLGLQGLLSILASLWFNLGLGACALSVFSMVLIKLLLINCPFSIRHISCRARISNFTSLFCGLDHQPKEHIVGSISSQIYDLIERRHLSRQNQRKQFVCSPTITKLCKSVRLAELRCCDHLRYLTQ